MRTRRSSVRGFEEEQNRQDGRVSAAHITTTERSGERLRHRSVRPGARLRAALPYGIVSIVAVFVGALGLGSLRAAHLARC
jgi:hypothetical protein